MSDRGNHGNEECIDAGAEKVAFGYRLVNASEKRALVSSQFDPIARRYDLADAVLSFGLHLRWKRWGIDQLVLREGERVLDVCGGTGDLAALTAARIGSLGYAYVYDINRPMMKAGRSKLQRSGLAKRVLLVEGDAEALSFPDAVFDVITVGFGIRNLVRLDVGLREMHRVLKPGGRLMILEFSLPARGWMHRLYYFYLFRVMPLGASIICGTGTPFRYLAESIRVFDPPERVAERLKDIGFADVRLRQCTSGVAVVYLARR